jgi:hypothetical protein
MEWRRVDCKRWLGIVGFEFERCGCHGERPGFAALCLSQAFWGVLRLLVDMHDPGRREAVEPGGGSTAVGADVLGIEQVLDIQLGQDF